MPIDYGIMIAKNPHPDDTYQDVDNETNELSAIERNIYGYYIMPKYKVSFEELSNVVEVQ